MKCKNIKCNKEHDGSFGGGNYCSRACANSRNHSIETKNKISKKLNGRLLSEQHKLKCTKHLQKLNSFKIIRSRYKNCIICGSKFNDTSRDATKTTCCKTCQTSAIFINRKYQNGSRKNIYYKSKNGNTIILESSWEEKIAIFLDELNIKWERPKPLKWFDNNLKEHLYYSDFYLIDYNLYLDPKNQYCIQKDKYKLEYFKNKIKLVYGDVKYITNYIENMLK